MILFIMQIQRQKNNQFNETMNIRKIIIEEHLSPDDKCSSINTYQYELIQVLVE